MINKIILPALFSVLLLSGISYSQQEVRYMDSDAIIKEMPDAQEVQKKIDDLVKEWQAELTKLQNEWKAKLEDYEKRKLIMSDKTRSEVESELVKMENKISEFRQKKFGPKGELSLKQEELMKPIHNKIFGVIKLYAEENKIDFIFDRSGDILFLYAKEKYDVTAEILKKLK